MFNASGSSSAPSNMFNASGSSSAPSKMFNASGSSSGPSKMSNARGNSSVPSKFLTGEEFRKYLERTGVMDSITRVLASLYEQPEWPLKPNEYLCMKFAEISKMDKLNDDAENLQERIKALEQTVNSLNAELNQLKSGSPNSGDLATEGASSLDPSASSLP